MEYYRKKEGQRCRNYKGPLLLGGYSSRSEMNDSGRAPRRHRVNQAEDRGRGKFAIDPSSAWNTLLYIKRTSIIGHHRLPSERISCKRQYFRHRSLKRQNGKYSEIFGETIDNSVFIRKIDWAKKKKKERKMSVKKVL